MDTKQLLKIIDREGIFVGGYAALAAELGGTADAVKSAVRNLTREGAINIVRSRPGVDGYVALARGPNLLGLNVDQQIAFATLKSFSKDSSARVAKITGAAGTGKSTLLKNIYKVFDDAMIATPTHKAANRLRTIGCVEPAHGIGTIASLLLVPATVPVLDKDGVQKIDVVDGVSVPRTKTVFVPRTAATPIAFPIIIDEASMVTVEDVRRLLDLGAQKIVLVGDSYQLPPLTGYCCLNMDTHPYEHELEEQMRQGEGSEILEIATAVRAADAGQVMQELEKLQKVEDGVKWIADCENAGRDYLATVFDNNSRHRINLDVRKKLGRVSTLEPGDKIISLACLPKDDVATSEIGRVINCSVAAAGVWCAELDFDGKRVECLIDDWTITNNVRPPMPESTIKEHERTAVLRAGKQWPLLRCAYAYVITAHSAQGSEADHGLTIFTRARQYVTENLKQWVYTSLTRAKKTAAGATL